MVFPASNTGLRKCDWGDKPIAYFKNYDGSTYRFFFHLNENEGETSVAHTVSFAPTGSGKTFLFQHLIAGTLYFYNNVNVYCFDSNLGLKVFTESVGGHYLELKNKSVQFNPLLLDLADNENRSFLSSWLQMISLCDDDNSLKLIEKALNILKSLPQSKKKLSKCLGELFPKKSKIYEALEKFAGGIHKNLFNGDKDSVSLEDNRLISFDMTSVLNDTKVCPAILTYIMYKIRIHAKRTALPHLVFIDETSAMLQNSVFKQYIEIMLREHRKLRGSINLVFQNVSDIVNEDDGKFTELILGQCKTRFVFKNVDAKNKVYQPLLGLNDLQMEFVKGTGSQVSHLSRPVLLQKENKIALLDVDLKPVLGKLVKHYTSSIDAVNFLSDLKKHEEDWLEIYQNTELKDLEVFREALEDEGKSLTYYELYKKQQQVLKEEKNHERTY